MPAALPEIVGETPPPQATSNALGSAYIKLTFSEATNRMEKVEPSIIAIQASSATPSSIALN
jgi:hypothetical protein